MQTIQWHLVHLEYYVSATSISKTFLLPQKEILYPLNSYSPFYSSSHPFKHLAPLMCILFL